jgi:hypothetical protein
MISQSSQFDGQGQGQPINDAAEIDYHINWPPTGTDYQADPWQHWGIDARTVPPNELETLRRVLAEQAASEPEPVDETPTVCRGCRVRGTWRNAGFCCTICYKSYGRHHGYYCTQEVGSDINTKLCRAIDVINPSIRWEQDYVDDLGLNTALERTLDQIPLPVDCQSKGDTDGRGDTDGSSKGDADGSGKGDADGGRQDEGSGGRWGRFGHVVTRTDGRCDMCGTHIDHVGDDPLGEYREDPQPFDTTGEYLEQPHVAGGLQTPPRADVPPPGAEGHVGPGKGKDKGKDKDGKDKSC